jgi:intracellular septation protein
MLLSFPLTLVFAFLQMPLLRRHWAGEHNPFAKEK